MGRRKIEILPITHERNRSVTFLKRKNGLFKKAYELGVLCSVDVAVIIFEQRPGHNVKLYQYCSGDANNIVQRHISFDGEKDTRGPSDFSGNAAAKLDDPADGDDDDQDDDEDLPPIGTKRRSDGSKAGTDVGLNIDVDYPRSGHQRPPSSGLAMSGERLSPSNNKKPRILPMQQPPSRSELPGGFSYAPSMRGASGSSSYTSPNTPYYQALPSQPSFGQSSSFEFSGARGQSQRNSLPTSYPEYSPIASSRPAPHRNASSGDPFAGLLDEDGPRQTHGIGGQNTAYGGIDWPVHSNNSGGSGVPRRKYSTEYGQPSIDRVY
ncbi:hypothetical protein DFH08DRAFT_868535 [Mycena albidolilacea]|uniref:MADS-box domain-containing protein n=1 Tax=Mycena albidolilacea TaxID=1033008 RepID=A0AAD7ERY4_9AGAR|nr:hypothetical protein DFH08DRAFT_868535 [Mycena albidolilacea]